MDSKNEKTTLTIPPFILTNNYGLPLTLTFLLPAISLLLSAAPRLNPPAPPAPAPGPWEACWPNELPPMPMPMPIPLFILLLFIPPIPIPIPMPLLGAKEFKLPVLPKAFPPKGAAWLPPAPNKLLFEVEVGMPWAGAPPNPPENGPAEEAPNEPEEVPEAAPKGPGAPPMALPKGAGEAVEAPKGAPEDPPNEFEPPAAPNAGVEEAGAALLLMPKVKELDVFVAAPPNAKAGAAPVFKAAGAPKLFVEDEKGLEAGTLLEKGLPLLAAL